MRGIDSPTANVTHIAVIIMVVFTMNHLTGYRPPEQLARQVDLICQERLDQLLPILSSAKVSHKIQ